MSKHYQILRFPFLALSLFATLGLAQGCNNTDVSISGLNAALGQIGNGGGLTKGLIFGPGVDMNGPVATATNGAYTIRGKVDSQSSATATNGTFTITAEVIQ